MATNETLYHPAAALVLFKPEGSDSGLYIEYYDMDENGCPVNPRPLSEREAQKLSKSLDTTAAVTKAFLTPEGLLPPYVLRINPANEGSVVWYTKAQKRMLYFRDSLGLASRELPVPALVWYADRHRLNVYAVRGNAKPRSGTPLCHAPFFNIYSNGNVCMGSVAVRIAKSATLEKFTKAWESYFFDSYFSHLIGGHNPIAGNLISLYKELAGAAQFPVSELLPNGTTVKDLLR